MYSDGGDCLVRGFEPTVPYTELPQFRVLECDRDRQQNSCCTSSWWRSNWTVNLEDEGLPV